MSAADDTPKTRIVSATRTVPAPASVIFDLLADPARHAEIDGSDTVRRSRDGGPVRLSLGARFGMDMKMFGVPYRMSNEVVEFEENRRIAWRHLGHHVWRYVLEPTGPDGGHTVVTESFDWGSARVPRFYEIVGYPRTHEANMTRTLERLEAAVTAR